MQESDEQNDQNEAHCRDSNTNENNAQVLDTERKLKNSVAKNQSAIKTKGHISALFRSCQKTDY
jgi:hypothetical protein